MFYNKCSMHFEVAVPTLNCASVSSWWKLGSASTAPSSAARNFCWKPKISRMLPKREVTSAAPLDIERNRESSSSARGSR